MREPSKITTAAGWGWCVYKELDGVDGTRPGSEFRDSPYGLPVNDKSLLKEQNVTVP